MNNTDLMECKMCGICVNARIRKNANENYMHGSGIYNISSLWLSLTI